MAKKRIAGVPAFLLASTFLTSIATTVCAQSTPNGAPPIRAMVDVNGVDLISGNYVAPTDAISIGAGDSMLVRKDSLYSYGSLVNLRDSLTGTLNYDSASGSFVVSLGDISDSFVCSNGVCTSSEGGGSTLTQNGTLTTYTASNGTVAVFDASNASAYPNSASLGNVVSVKKPSGEILKYTYESSTLCDYWSGGTCSRSYSATRVISIVSSAGYMLHYDYASNAQLSLANGQFWTSSNLTVADVMAINLVFDYCAPNSEACTGLTHTWPKVSYAMDQSNNTTITDPLGRVTKVSGVTGGITILSPGGNAKTILFSSGSAGIGNGRVSSVSNGAGTWTYTYSTSGNQLTVTVKDPLGHQRQVTSDQTLLQPISDIVDPGTGGLNRTTTYGYDTYGRVYQVTFPEGNQLRYTYDARGNVVELDKISKDGLSTISTTANYDATCPSSMTQAQAVKCNQPNWTKDALGHETDYAYDSGSGLLKTVTLPAPSADSNAIRPQINYTYQQLTATYLQPNSSGTAVQTPGAATWMLTQVSQCATGATCSVGSSDQVVTNITYDDANSGAYNLLPTTVTKGSGYNNLTAKTTATYDMIGNVSTVTGPAIGAPLVSPTVQYRYDADRQLSGVVGPDPDGSSGPLQNRAIKISRECSSTVTAGCDGLVTLVERGYVPDQSDSAWNNSFTSKQQVATAYDSIDRKTQTSVTANGVTYSVVQYAYDNANHLTCTAVRMNLSSLPSSACTAGTVGAAGPDRITTYAYDNADELTTVTNGSGTSAQRNDVVRVYNPNGTVKTEADGKGNLTTYTYDGFDRLTKIAYPDPTNGSTSSTTDYEQFDYDANSNVLHDYRRPAGNTSSPGPVIAYTYDYLNRVIQKSLPATTYYTYDNLNRMTSVAYDNGGQKVSFNYDTLGRLTQQSGPLGAVQYQYDLAGHRTQMTWPGTDNFSVNYVWDYAGDLTEITDGSNNPLVSFSYDNLGRRIALTRNNGVGTSTAYTWDDASRLTKLTQPSAAAWNFSYNPAGQIVSKSVPSGYALTPPAANTLSYTLNGQNQVTASQSGSTNYTLSYDGQGNLASDGVTGYCYDAGNRLISTNSQPSSGCAVGSKLASLAYDPQGRLSQVTSSGGTVTQFGYDGDDLIAEYDGSGKLLRRYVHGPGNDELLVHYEYLPSGTTDVRWLLADHQGTVVAETNGSGAVVNTSQGAVVNTYDEYGVPAAANQGRFQFTGQNWLQEVGLYYYKARMYSPTLGRFMQADPIGYGDGMNMYAYVQGDPINLNDPSGDDDVPVEVTGVTVTWENGPTEPNPGFQSGAGGSYVGSSDGEKGAGKGDEPTTVRGLVVTLHVHRSGSWGGAPQNNQGCPSGPAAKFARSVMKHAGDLQSAADWTSVGAAGATAIGAVTLQPEIVAFGATGVAVSKFVSGGAFLAQASAGAYLYFNGDPKPLNSLLAQKAMPLPPALPGTDVAGRLGDELSEKMYPNNHCQ